MSEVGQAPASPRDPHCCSPDDYNRDGVLVPDFLSDMSWVPGIRSDVLTPVFKGFTSLGGRELLFSFLPVGYWLWRKQLFARTWILVLATVFVMGYLKALWMDPRPDASLHLIEAGGYGFPSGHAMLAVVLWGWLAWSLRETWAWITGAILAAGQAFSRIYLGVHDPEDVLGGLMFGLACAVSFELLLRLELDRWHRLRPALQLAVIAGVQLLCFALMPVAVPALSLTTGALLLGFWAGVRLERCRGQFQRHRDWWRGVGVAIFGVASVWLIGPGLEKLLYDHLELTYPAVRYAHRAALGLWIGAAAPALFQRLRLLR